MSDIEIGDRLEITNTTVQTVRSDYSKCGIRLLCKTCVEEGIVEHMAPTTMVKVFLG